MNPLSATNPAPDWLRELVTARTRYEELLGWPVRVDVQSRCVTVPVGIVLDALTMPAPLGEKVRVEPGLTRLGPVAADPQGERWTFLTQPAVATHRDIPAELRELEVHTAAHGTPMVIPTGIEDAGDGGWQWVELPRPRQSLPPWSAVLSAIRRIAAELVSSGPGGLRAPRLDR